MLDLEKKNSFYNIYILNKMYLVILALAFAAMMIYIFGGNSVDTSATEAQIATAAIATDAADRSMHRPLDGKFEYGFIRDHSNAIMNSISRIDSSVNKRSLILRPH